MRRLPALAVAMFLLAACSQDDGGTTTRAVDSGRSERPAGAAAPSDAATTGDDSAGVDDDASEDIAGDTGGDVADLRVAQPGTWPVGDVGTVTFDLVDGRPVLEDHQVAEGWDATTQEDDDEIQVDFTRDNVRWEFDAETDDGRLEVDIRQDHLDARADTYDMTEAGLFTFSRNDGALTMDSIDLDDGWSVTEREDDSDTLEFEAREGDREVDVEVELDDGRIEVEIDYSVTSTLQE